MSHTFMSNLWYYILALVWAVYVSQELFVTGTSMLSRMYNVESKEFKVMNEAVGTHWDGIQVWLIVAIGGLFAVFYDAYAVLLSSLYIPFFLLLYAIILRGLSIELIYKAESPKYRKAMAWIWPISSFLLIFIIGVYLTNLFTGLPLENELLTSNFLIIFNRITLLGGLFFVAAAITMGTLWTRLACGVEYTKKLDWFLKWVSTAMALLLVCMYLAFNHKTEGFAEGLFVTYPILWLLPVVSMLAGLVSTLATIKNKNKTAFVATITMMITFIFTGFSLTFPYIVLSTIGTSESLLIVDASASEYALRLMTISVAIFVPIVIGYQTWKYLKFWKR